MAIETMMSDEHYDSIVAQVGQLETRLEQALRRLDNIEMGLANEHDNDLELEISEMFRAKALRVYVSRNPSLGRAAAHVFEQLVRPDEGKIGVGLSGGKTILAMVEHLSREYENLAIHALSCPGLPEDVGFSVNTVVGYFCMKHKKTVGYHIPVDPLVAGHLSATEMDNIRARMLENANEVRYAFTGIGTTNALERLVERFEPKIDLQQYEVVGDMLYRPLKADGQIADIPSLNQRIVGLTPEDLKRRLNGEGIRNIVGVASGKHKAEAVHAACLGGFVNYLVIDVALANELKKIHENQDS